MESLYAAVRALLNSAHKVGALSEADRDAHLAALEGEDPGHAAAEQAAAEAAAAARKAEYEKLRAEFEAGPAVPPVPVPGGGFNQAAF